MGVRRAEPGDVDMPFRVGVAGVLEIAGKRLGGVRRTGLVAALREPEPEASTERSLRGRDCERGRGRGRARGTWWEVDGDEVDACDDGPAVDVDATGCEGLRSTGREAHELGTASKGERTALPNPALELGLVFGRLTRAGRGT